MAGTLSTTAHPGLLAAAIALDLVILVPLVFYILVVRRRNWSALAVAPVVLAGFVAASLILPPVHQDALRILEWLIIPAELGLLGYGLFVTIQAVRTAAVQPEPDVLTRLRTALSDRLPGRLATVLAYELAVFYYAFMSWRLTAPAGPVVFGYTRRGGYGGVLLGILVAACMELVAVHVLVSLWSPAAAWLLSALSAYGAVWILAEWRAAHLRPIEVRGDVLILRSGLRWTVSVPTSTIRAVWRAADRPPPPDASHELDLTPTGAPHYLAELHTPVVAHGLYGYRRTATALRFAVDDPARFEAILGPRVAASSASDS